MKNDWSWGVTVEYDVFIDGNQTSHLEDGNVGYDTSTNDQNDGYGLRGSVRVMKQTDAIDFFVEPFVRYWDIEDSEVSLTTVNGAVVGAGLEPTNNTTEYGLKIGICY